MEQDLIKTSGYQVWPRGLSHRLASSAVAEVGVAGVADETKGEAVRAWVVLRQGQDVSGADLRACLPRRLAPYRCQSRVEFRKDLPKTLVGKILRRALKDRSGPLRSTRATFTFAGTRRPRSSASDAAHKQHRQRRWFGNRRRFWCHTEHGWRTQIADDAEVVGRAVHTGTIVMASAGLQSATTIIAVISRAWSEATHR